MVKVMCDDGVNFFHEPPYTEEEEDAFYAAMSKGPITILRPKTVATPAPKSQPRSPEE